MSNEWAAVGRGGTDGSDSRSVLIRRFLIGRGPLILFALMFVYLAVGAPSFLSTANILSSLVRAAPIAIVAMGLAVVVMGGGDDVVAGGIDLSIPATAALGAAVMSHQLTNLDASFAWALLVALLAALVVGVVNAVLVTVVGLTSILTTLATYASVVGIIRVLTANRRIGVDDPTVLFLRDGRLLGIPMPIVLMLAAFAVLAFVMHRTGFGMRVQAVGGGREVAATSGISPRRHIAWTFVIASVAGAVAAIALVTRASGSSPGMDERLMVDMVLAGFVGAAFSPRNVVTVPGALLGAILVSLMSNGLILNRVDNSWIDGFKGVLILVVVASAALQNRERS